MRFYFFATILFFGCTTVIAQSKQHDSANANTDVMSFEQAKALSASDIPDIYDISRLSKGSKVKIKHTREGSSEIYFTVKTVQDIKEQDSGKIYIIDTISGGKTYTSSEDSASLRKVISPYENTQPLADFKDLPASSLPQQALNVIGTGNIAIGVVTAPIEHAREKERNKEIGDQLRAMRIERKIIDFKYVSDETLKVADKNILCKVYEAHSLTRDIMPSSKILSSSSLATAGSQRIWISEDVPFGVVKTESTYTMYMPVAGNNRSGTTILPSSLTTRQTSEVVEFSY